MSAATWSSLNQRYLWAAVGSLRERLDSGTATKPEPSAEPLPKPDWSVNQPSPALETLCRVFRLSDFERSIVLLCAAVELEPSLALTCAALQGNPPRPYPTFHLALRCLPNPHWDALTPMAPLRHWQLIDVQGDDLLATRPLRLDERILHYLMGIAYVDPALDGLVALLPATEGLPPSQQALATRIQQLWSHKGETNLPLVHLCGAEPTSRSEIVTAACQAIGIRLYGMDAADVPTDSDGRDRLRRRWDREAALSNSALLVHSSALSEREHPPALLPFLQRLRSRTVLSTLEPITLLQRDAVRLDVVRPSHAEQASLWREALGPQATKLNGQIGQIVSQFDLEPAQIRQASATVKLSCSAEIDSALWNACRQQARVVLEDLAQRLTPLATWDDLVLPEPQQRTLHEIVVAVQQRSQVYENWGFSQKNSRGLGISALFAGSSGTGKTMAAEILAQALQLDIYRIDLSAVVSKYIGETEKNLRRIFDAAEQGGVILLFDEADALFGKRSEVKDAHDRHANIEVSYLLQRMEAYRGLAILTTNFKSALDTAFLRRIRFVVPFPFPGMTQRLEIWQRVFPSQTPTQDLAYSKLARLTVAGGNIHSIAMNAAFLAAAEGLPVQMQHLLRASQSEYAKLEKPLADAEVRGWI
jgi:ATP-dependent 26S proteasome regulatory subunit